MKGRPLIFSASIGQGHNQAAKAIQQEFLKQGYNPRIIDTFHAIHPFLHTFMVRSYIQLLKVTPSLWGRMYFKAEKQPLFLLLDRFGTLFVDHLYSMMIKEECPFLISTHPFVTAFLTRVKQVKKVNIPLYTVITDFVLHPAYLREEIDGYFTASNDIEPFANVHNVHSHRFYSTGIPICENTCFTKSKAYVRNELGLDRQRKIILIAGGGIGLTDYVKVIQSLEYIKDQIQVICMVGHNEKVKKKILKQETKHTVKVVGFTNHFMQYLKACDAIISKAGGLTLSEALACETPMVIYKPVPGHEEHNAQYLSQTGAAIKVDQDDQLPKVIATLLYEQDVYEEMTSLAKKIKKPHAANHIVEKILMLTDRMNLYEAQKS
ncbi:MGDG synthase family glycosyltransferase [Evansella halocellulosilytica]|uniref:MGDG synthase family glycosyltransferase n=1 Tax=Evansella halocellulosilytica TaxID=2011013 RepID=UPI00115603BB|nr:glycosyltransferase [Evansella halocellulosilytica]